MNALCAWKRRNRRAVPARAAWAWADRAAPRDRAGSPRRAMVLVVVLVAVALLTLGALGYTELMLAHREAAAESARQAQARAAAESGIEAVRWLLTLPPEQQREVGGLYDNRALLAGAIVVDSDDAFERARFALVAPVVQEDRVVGIRFGLEDESARLNLNALKMLAAKSKSRSSSGGAEQESDQDGSGDTPGGASGASGASGGTSSGGASRGGRSSSGGRSSGGGSSGSTGGGTQPGGGGPSGGGASGSGGGPGGGSSSGGSRNPPAVRGSQGDLGSAGLPGELDDQDAGDEGEDANAAAGPSERDILMALPGMTEAIADAILDFIDEDDEPREFGAESEYYGALVPPYKPKNKPLDSIEELLLVRDVTPQLLFGADVNFNALADPDEIDPMMLEGVDNSTGEMDRGWAAYLTLDSRQREVRPDGTAKIDLNSDDLEQLYADLDEALGTQWATFIVAYRQNGPYDGDERGRQGATGKLDLTQPAKATLDSPLDLIGARVEVQFDGDEEPTILESPLPDARGDSADMLGTLLDQTTTEKKSVIVGRVNVNLAPRAVLCAVPGITPDLADAIIAQRVENPVEAPASHRHATWILSEGLVELDKMKELYPRLCGGGCVYRAQAIGYFDRSGPAVRLEAYLDASSPLPKLLRLRDLTPLGRGYPSELLGAQGDAGGVVGP